jgi:hypothetical protein
MDLGGWGMGPVRFVVEACAWIVAGVLVLFVVLWKIETAVDRLRRREMERWLETERWLVEKAEKARVEPHEDEG